MRGFQAFFSHLDYGLWHGNATFMHFFHEEKKKKANRKPNQNKKPTKVQPRLMCSCFQGVTCTTYSLSAFPTIWGLNSFCNHKLTNHVIQIHIQSSIFLKH